MRDREWLLIALGALVIVLGTTLAALCAAGVLPQPDDPPEPGIEQVRSTGSY